MKNTRKNKIKDTRSDRIFGFIIIFLTILINITMIYPFLYVVSTAISDKAQVMAGNVWLYPIGFNLDSIKQIVEYPYFMSSYANTIFYSIFATIFLLFMTTLTAYPLSRDNFRLKGLLSKIYVFTMFFGGGMIPTYLIYKSYGLVDNRLVMILPGAIAAWYLIICRTFFKGIPESLFESAHLDGANELTILYKIVLPLSKPVLATLTLFSMVGTWNDFFTALIYFNKNALFPLQLVLRTILINSQLGASATEIDMSELSKRASTISLKSASIIISILPIICVYPFVQQYFVKGVMVGSVKG